MPSSTTVFPPNNSLVWKHPYFYPYPILSYSRAKRPNTRYYPYFAAHNCRYSPHSPKQTLPQFGSLHAILIPFPTQEFHSRHVTNHHSNEQTRPDSASARCVRPAGYALTSRNVHSLNYNNQLDARLTTNPLTDPDILHEIF